MRDGAAVAATVVVAVVVVAMGVVAVVIVAVLFGVMVTTSARPLTPRAHGAHTALAAVRNPEDSE